MKKLVHTCLFVVVLASGCAMAQAVVPTNPCPSGTGTGGGSGTCDPYLTLTPGQFHATPFIDVTCNPPSQPCPSYGDHDLNTVALYGAYGNNESTNNSAVTAHYTAGKNLASNIVPLCKDGNPPPCLPLMSPAAIVFLFIGFSNCDIEICGGNSDSWDGQDMDPALNQFHHHLPGQPCATYCPNLHNPNPQKFPVAWNQVKGGDQIVGGDGVTQQSFLYQIYSPPTPLVGPDVVVFNGATGGQTLDKWDPTPNGWYAKHNDCMGDESHDPECDYEIVMDALNAAGYSEEQVQAVFLKAADPYPQCDMLLKYCAPNSTEANADAYQAETYLGDIMRYLKCCELNADGSSSGIARYPHLQQVFITSRIYGGYADGLLDSTGAPLADACLNPEPFAFEEAFAVQRLIVAQLSQNAHIPYYDPYSGLVDSTTSAPWFDWGPYLWANGVNISPNSNLNWCDSSTRSDFRCNGNLGDVRYGDLNAGWNQYFGDHTHPTYQGQAKVATQLIKWIQGGNQLGIQSFISDWITLWIGR